MEDISVFGYSILASLIATILGGLGMWIYQRIFRNNEFANDIKLLKDEIHIIQQNLENGFERVNIRFDRVNVDYNRITQELAKLSSDHEGTIREVEDKIKRSEESIFRHVGNILGETRQRKVPPFHRSW